MSISLLPAPPASPNRPDSPEPSDDVLLERAVREAIRRRCDRSVRGLAVWVDERVVTLRGQTRSFYEKQLVLHATQQVGGLDGIVDEIAVAAR